MAIYWISFGCRSAQSANDTTQKRKLFRSCLHCVATWPFRTCRSADFHLAEIEKRRDVSIAKKRSENDLFITFAVMCQMQTIPRRQSKLTRAMPTIWILNACASRNMFHKMKLTCAATQKRSTDGCRVHVVRLMLFFVLVHVFGVVCGRARQKHFHIRHSPPNNGIEFWNFRNHALRMSKCMRFNVSYALSGDGTVDDDAPSTDPKCTNAWKIKKYINAHTNEIATPEWIKCN